VRVIGTTFPDKDIVKTINSGPGPNRSVARDVGIFSSC